jgi:toluene monooxygenase system ferredoxin subunit
MAFQAVASLDELWSGEMAACRVRDTRVVLINLGGTIRAYADVCPHMRTPLSEGALVGATLTCATHGWVFDVLTGRGVNPAQSCLTEFSVVIEGNEILVDIDQPSVHPSTFMSREKSG